MVCAKHVKLAITVDSPLRYPNRQNSRSIIFNHDRLAHLIALRPFPALSQGPHDGAIDSEIFVHSGKTELVPAR